MNIIRQFKALFQPRLSDKDILRQLERSMYGVNYEVKFGIDYLGNCEDMEGFKTALRKVYPNSHPEKTSPISISLDDLWSEINYGFDYRGNNAAGLLLNKKQERAIKKIQNSYKELVGTFVTKNASIYSYPVNKEFPATLYFGISGLLS